jgi:putative chitinase
MQITKEQLVKIMPKLANHPTLDSKLIAINNTVERFGITSKENTAAFLATLALESNQLTTYSENLSYSAERLLEVFPKYFNKDNVEEYAFKPNKIASRVYGNRMGNGDERTGEGYIFCGAGAIQITGKNNHMACASYFGIALHDIGAWLRVDKGAILSAGYFWQTHKIGEYADKEDLDGVRDLVNIGHKTGAQGDAIGFREFKTYYNAAKKALGA